MCTLQTKQKQKQLGTARDQNIREKNIGISGSHHFVPRYSDILIPDTLLLILRYSDPRYSPPGTLILFSLIFLFHESFHLRF